MSEYKTLDELFPNGRGDGRKFVEISSGQIFEPVIKAIQFGYHKRIWFVVDEKGHIDSFSDHIDVKFKEYVAPKKKVTKYLWVRTSDRFIYPRMAENFQELESIYGFHHRKENNFLRLDWSATEFDDE